MEQRSKIRSLTYQPNRFPLYTLLCRTPELQLLSLMDRGYGYGFADCQTLKTDKSLGSLRYLYLRTGRSRPDYPCNLSNVVNLFVMAPNIKTLAIELGQLE
jgi:hypothetical protein